MTFGLLGAILYGLGMFALYSLVTIAWLIWGLLVILWEVGKAVHAVFHSPVSDAERVRWAEKELDRHRRVKTGYLRAARRGTTVIEVMHGGRVSVVLSDDSDEEASRMPPAALEMATRPPSQGSVRAGRPVPLRVAQGTSGSTDTPGMNQTRS